jgi:hypothetical protein
MGHPLTYALRRTPEPRHDLLHTDDPHLRQPGLDPLLLRTRKGARSLDGDESAPSLVLEDENQNPAFSHILPQSRADDIREVKILFNRILRDRSDVESTATTSLPFADKKSRGWS